MREKVVNHLNAARQPRAGLGQASLLWTDMQRANPDVEPHKLWPKFLASIKHDAKVHEAAISMIIPPERPRIDPRQAEQYRNKLIAWASKHGVFELENRARAALQSDKLEEASRLRNEALEIMRKGAATVAWSSA
jgi:hypothetical protein